MQRTSTTHAVPLHALHALLPPFVSHRQAPARVHRCNEGATSNGCISASFNGVRTRKGIASRPPRACARVCAIVRTHDWQPNAINFSLFLTRTRVILSSFFSTFDIFQRERESDRSSSQKARRYSADRFVQTVIVSRSDNSLYRINCWRNLLAC